MNVAYAQSTQILISTAGGLRMALCNIFSILFWILMAVSTVVILIGAFIYATAQGDSEKVSRGTKLIIYAVIGLAVALIAKQFPVIIGDFFGKYYGNYCYSGDGTILPGSPPVNP